MYFIIIEISYILRNKWAHIHNETNLCHGDHISILCILPLGPPDGSISLVAFPLKKLKYTGSERKA